MRFFIDTAEIEDIRELHKSGMVDGVTTNPTLIARSGRDMLKTIAEICALVDGPVSAEVSSTDTDGMVAEGTKLSKIAQNICVKLPTTWAGLEACKHFSNAGIATNMTLCFSPSQALLAAKAGASYISPFIGRLDDIGQEGMELIQSITTIYANYPDLKTEILVASVRSSNHVVKAAELGADVATIPPKVMRGLLSHPLTDKGLAAFLKDWAGTGQSIL